MLVPSRRHGCALCVSWHLHAILSDGTPLALLPPGAPASGAASEPVMISKLTYAIIVILAMLAVVFIAGNVDMSLGTLDLDAP